MTLHEELNQNIAGNNFMNLNNINNNNIEIVYKSFIEDYKRSYRSKISEIFYAIQQNTTKCLNCNNNQYNFQAYFFLVFPLEEVKKYAIEKVNKNNQLLMNNNNFGNNFNMSMNMNMMNNNNMNFNFFSPMNFGFNNMFNNPMNMNMNINNQIMNNNFNQFIPNNNFSINPFMQLNNNNNFINNNNNNQNIILNKLNNNIVNILDCFEYNQKAEIFYDNNQIYCNNCHQMSNAECETNLTTVPKVLILLLNRGSGIKSKIKLEFTTELDITNYLSQKTGNIKYKLIGVITHLGEDGASGHFIAHCLSPIDNRWYTYNDSFVSIIDDFQKQIIDLGMPYLLFYQKIE